jgi:hypothetical protein
MMHRRPFTWLLALSVVGFGVGCSLRPTVAPIVEAVSADPAPDKTGENRNADAPPFHFPDDAGGAILAKVLPPADVKGGDSLREAPRPAEQAAHHPSLDVLPPSPPPAPPIPAEHGRPSPAPRLVMNENLGLARDPEPPAPRVFVVGDRTRLPSVDSNQPPLLPILTQQPTLDRAPLDDPTVDASTDAALAATMPQRTNPAPYVRVILPDPFDNRRPLSLPLPAEDDRPRTGTVHPPKP